MKDILDFEEQEIQTDYTKKAFRNFLYALIGFGFILLRGLSRYFNLSIGEIFESLMVIVILAMIVFSIIGLINSIKSFRKQEPNSIQKYIGLIGNLVFVGLVFLLIIVNVMDVLNYLNS